jgi:hypothetical protein
MICLSSAGNPTSFQMLVKNWMSKHWHYCATSTLNEFTLENVTAALSVTEITAERRVLSSLATEGHLSHYALGERKKHAERSMP